MKAILREVSRVLRPGGKFFMISHSVPENRLPYLTVCFTLFSSSSFFPLRLSYLLHVVVVALYHWIPHTHPLCANRQVYSTLTYLIPLPLVRMLHIDCMYSLHPQPHTRLPLTFFFVICLLLLHYHRQTAYWTL